MDSAPPFQGENGGHQQTEESSTSREPQLGGQRATAFEDRFEQFYMQFADGKTGGMVACVQGMQDIVDSARQRRGETDSTAPSDATSQDPKTAIYEEMLLDCRKKAAEATLDRLRQLCQRGGANVDGDEAAAMMGEEEPVIVGYHAALLGRSEDAANIYGGFLRRRLKQANDAAVKKLSSSRALHRLNIASNGAASVGAEGGAFGAGAGDNSTRHAGDLDGPQTAGADPHPHITALATILGETSKILARLAASYLEQEVKGPVARLLHEESKTQAVKVLEWFQQDTDLPRWRGQVSGAGSKSGRAGGHDGRGSSRSPVSSAPTSGNSGLGRFGSSPPSSVSGLLAASSPTAFDARGMDFVIDELALACQYCQRYLDFVAGNLGLTEDLSSEFFAQVRLVEGVYAQLEDAYCLRSIEEAMRIAEPIEVQDGTYVSSMVEDASFLVQKSLTRSVSTRSEQAIMAVCNRVTEDALDRFLEASNPLVSLMLDEVARILAAYQELRDSRLNDVLEALFPPVRKALFSAFGTASYALGPSEYELRSSELSGAQRVLQAATQAMTGAGEGVGGYGSARVTGGCRASLLPEPFEELVRKLATRIADGMVSAARAKGSGGVGAVGGRGAGGGGGGFTEWGALLLRQEVRKLQQELAGLMETDLLNSEFGEVNELVHLLNLERPSDIHEYRLPPPPPRSSDSRSGVSPREPLSPSSVRAVLRLRVDFHRHAIEALEL